MTHAESRLCDWRAAAADEHKFRIRKAVVCHVIFLVCHVICHVIFHVCHVISIGRWSSKVFVSVSECWLAGNRCFWCAYVWRLFVLVCVCVKVVCFRVRMCEDCLFSCAYVWRLFVFFFFFLNCVWAWVHVLFLLLLSTMDLYCPFYFDVCKSLTSER